MLYDHFAIEVEILDFGTELFVMTCFLKIVKSGGIPHFSCKHSKSFYKCKTYAKTVNAITV